MRKQVPKRNRRPGQRVSGTGGIQSSSSTLMIQRRVNRVCTTSALLTHDLAVLAKMLDSADFTILALSAGRLAHALHLCAECLALEGRLAA